MSYHELNDQISKMDDGEVVQMIVFTQKLMPLEAPILDMNDKYNLNQTGSPNWFYQFDYKAMEKAKLSKDAIDYYKSYENLTHPNSHSWTGVAGTPKSGKFIGWSQQNCKLHSNLFQGYASAISQFNEWIKNNTEKVKIAKGKRIRYCKVRLQWVNLLPSNNSPTIIIVVYTLNEKGDFLNES